MVMLRLLQRLALPVLALTLAAFACAGATVPGAPYLAGSIEKATGPDGVVYYGVWLNWKPAQDNNVLPDGYYVYQLTSKDTTQFFRIASSTDYSLHLTNLKPDFYQFYVTAYNRDGESKPSQIVTLRVTLGDTATKPTIKIETTPPTTASFDKEYIYQLRAWASNGGALRYKLVQPPFGAPYMEPTGMTVDANGLVRWTPTANHLPGRYGAAVLVYLASDESVTAMQPWMFTLGSTNACASLFGKVIDAVDGHPLPTGKVAAWLIGSTPDPNGGVASEVFATEFKDGQYAMKVPQGTYILRADAPGYTGVWFQNAYSADQAQRVPVSCNTDVMASFVMKPSGDTVYPTTYVIKGHVSSAANGTPVQAYVQFIARDLQSSVGANTDQNGDYSVTLTSPSGYVAQAVPADNKYLAQYFDRTGNISAASVVTAKYQGAPVDFPLEARQPDYNGYFSGRVMGADGALLYAKVAAFRLPIKDPANVWTNFVASTVSDSMGFYSFSNLPDGRYIAMAYPAYDQYVPGYYADGGSAVLEWKDASPITLNVRRFYDIILPRRQGTKGIASLSGSVFAQTGATKSGARISGRQPVAGATVYAVDAGGYVSDYAQTDVAGVFQLNQLGIGDYTIVVNKEGYDVEHRLMPFNAEKNAAVQTEFTLNAAVSSVTDPTGVSATTVTWPNPAGNDLFVQFAATGSAPARISLTNALGTVVLTKQANAGAGSARLNVSTLPAGAYLLQVQSGEITTTTTVRVVR